MFSNRQFTLRDVSISISPVWLLVVLALLVVTLNEVAPGTLTANPGGEWITAALLVIVGVIGSVAVHEFAHVYAARFRSQGALRIEPAALTALPDVDYFPRSPARDAVIGLAGPAANLTLCGLLAMIWLVLSGASGGVLVESVKILALANGGLALLGLMPGYPFDGARALRAFVWYITDDLLTATKVVAYYGYVLILAGLAIGVFMVAAGRIFSVWGVWVLVTIWMCNRTAIAGVTELFLILRSESLRIDDVILGTGRRIQADAKIEDAVEPLLEAHQSGPSLVMRDGQAVGLIDLAALRGVPRAEWRTRTVVDVMRPLDGHRRVDIRSSLREALESLPPGSKEIILLERGGRIIGAATRDVIIDHVREYLAAERLEELRRS